MGGHHPKPVSNGDAKSRLAVPLAVVLTLIAMVASGVYVGARIEARLGEVAAILVDFRGTLLEHDRRIREVEIRSRANEERSLANAAALDVRLQRIEAAVLRIEDRVLGR